MDSINKLTELFKKFPTVGSRTAGRFVYYLMKLPKEKTDELINAIIELKKNVKLCSLCFNPFEPNHNSSGLEMCLICQDSRRDKNLLCIVEKEADLLSIESTKKFNGLYFILGGTVATMRKDDLSQLRIEELKKRIMYSFGTQGVTPQDDSRLSEIIVALNPTPEGRVTSVLIEQIIKEVIQSPSLKITHLAKGLPVGGELEYADEETLESALEGRK